MKGSVEIMRKKLAWMLGVLLVCALAVGVTAAETLQLTGARGSVEVDSTSYIVLTHSNLSQHPDWLESHGTTSDAMLEDWDARGVVAQAWTRGDDVCIEVSSLVDDAAQQFYNIDSVTADMRATYRMNHLNGNYYGSAGYTYTSVSWSKLKNSGRWLALEYRYASGSSSHRGIQYRTVRNGYTITIDYQIYGRETLKADSKAMKTIMGTYRFSEVVSKPANYVSKVIFTDQPPTETTTGKFKVAGTCDEGMHLTAVAMRMSSSDKVVVEDTAGKTGKFSMSFQLPSEGIWLVTVTVDKNGVETENKIFDITTYQPSLLKVTWTDPIPEKLTADTVMISGTTLKGTTVQCIVNDGSYSKQVVTGGKGTFSFKIPTEQAGDYEIVLVFQKKGYDTRRFTGVANRNISEEEVREKARTSAVKPAYTTLVEKIKGYTGKVLTYQMYTVSVSRSGDEWVMIMAMSSTKNGYKNYVAVTCDEEPNVTIGSQYRVYGTCIGTYLVQEEGAGDKYYPCIDLLWIE